MRPHRPLASLLRVFGSPASAALPSTLEAPHRLVSALRADFRTRGASTACQVAFEATRVCERSSASTIASECDTYGAAVASAAARGASYSEQSCSEASREPASQCRRGAAESAESAEKTRGWTVAVEGNIGVGKSTVLSALGARLNSDVALRRAVTGGADVALQPEPLREWRNVRGSGENALDAFYKDPKRFAYTFQSLVFISRASQYRHGLQQHPSALRLCERSLFCDRLVFAPAAVAGGLFTPLEEALYDSWVDAVLPMLPGVVPDAFIYLRADPSVCLQRLKQRSRSEETSVDLPYLQRLHELYDRWFLEGSHRTDPEHAAAPSFRATLDGALTHSALDGVPGLVVDCNQHIQQCDGDIVEPRGDMGEGGERLGKGAIMGSGSGVAEALPGAKSRAPFLSPPPFPSSPHPRSSTLETAMGRAKRLKPRMWKSAFDAEGRLVRMPQVLKAILEGGVDKSIRGEVWEFLLGCFSLESTAEERNYVREARRERYQQLLLQCQQMHSNVGSGHLAFAVGTRIMDVRIIHPGNTPGSSGGAFSASGFSTSSSHPSAGTALHHRAPVQDHYRSSESQKQQYSDVPLAKSFSSSLPAVGGEGDVGSPMHAVSGADRWHAVSGGVGGGGGGMGQGGEGGEDEGLEEGAGEGGWEGREGGAGGATDGGAGGRRLGKEGRPPAGELGGVGAAQGAHKGGGEGGAGAAWVRGMKKAHKKLIGYLGASDSFGGREGVGAGGGVGVGTGGGGQGDGGGGGVLGGGKVVGKLGGEGHEGGVLGGGGGGAGGGRAGARRRLRKVLSADWGSTSLDELLGGKGLAASASTNLSSSSSQPTRPSTAAGSTAGNAGGNAAGNAAGLASSGTPIPGHLSTHSHSSTPPRSTSSAAASPSPSSALLPPSSSSILSHRPDSAGSSSSSRRSRSAGMTLVDFAGITAPSPEPVAGAVAGPVAGALAGPVAGSMEGGEVWGMVRSGSQGLGQHGRESALGSRERMSFGGGGDIVDGRERDKGREGEGEREGEREGKDERDVWEALQARSSLSGGTAASGAAGGDGPAAAGAVSVGVSGVDDFTAGAAGGERESAEDADPAPIAAGCAIGRSVGGRGAPGEASLRVWYSGGEGRAEGRGAERAPDGAGRLEGVREGRVGEDRGAGAVVGPSPLPATAAVADAAAGAGVLGGVGAAGTAERVGTDARGAVGGTEQEQSREEAMMMRRRGRGGWMGEEREERRRGEAQVVGVRRGAEGAGGAGGVGGAAEGWRGMGRRVEGGGVGRGEGGEGGDGVEESGKEEEGKGGEGAEGGEEEGGQKAQLTVDPVVAARLGVTVERVADWLWTLHKISVDVERTDTHMAFYQAERNRATMCDILAVHAWIDPATGFCQGMCDILSPFIMLYAHPADAFWCFECLFSRIRHNFVLEGPVGILRQLAVLRDVVALVDPELASHLEELGADNFMFAFRMLLVLFRRELPLVDVIVMWEMMWAADFDSRMASVLLHHPPEGLNLVAEPHTWSTGPLPPLDSPTNDAATTPVPFSTASNQGSGSSLGGFDVMGLGGGRRGGIWRSGQLTAQDVEGGASLMSQWGEARVGDEDLAVFCVAAILRVNRKRLLLVEGSDEAIKMFNDVELVLDVVSCIHLAIKLRTKYFRKSVAEEARGYLEKAEEDFLQFTQHLGRALILTTIPGVVLETLRELSGSRVQGWDVVWFCWAAGLVLGCMVGVGEVMQKHQRRRAAARLPPRRVVLTGGSRGLGKAMAREFLLAGDDVLLTSRSEQGVEEALRALQQDTWHITGRAPVAVLVKAGSNRMESTQSSREVWELPQAHGVQQQEKQRHEQQRVVGIACDVRSASDVQMLADVARQELGRVNIWVNNAGTNPMAKPFADFEDHELEQVVSTNLLGSLLCTRAAMRLMQQQPPSLPHQTTGHVFNLEGAGSWGGATPQYAAYGATKCALRQLGASLVEEGRLEGSERGREVGTGVGNDSRREGGSEGASGGGVEKGGGRRGRVGIHAASPGLVLTDLLLSGATVANKQAFNIVGEHPETVARVLVPQMRTVRGTGSTVSYLTPPRIVLAILSAWMRRGRWFDQQAVYATEAQRLRAWAEGRDRSAIGAAMDAVPSIAWLSLASILPLSVSHIAAGAGRNSGT
ncbi:unnamed protein product [Closterium sp. NIES-65]|nr:unnamed protein product [Closterium sp. NIES-65]